MPEQKRELLTCLSFSPHRRRATYLEVTRDRLEDQVRDSQSAKASKVSLFTSDTASNVLNLTQTSVTADPGP
jgi:hypothetical protein